MKKLIFGVLALVIFLGACDKPIVYEEVQGDDKHLKLMFTDVDLTSSPYKIHKVVPLETNQSNLLSDNLTVKFTSKFIFVFDEQIRDAIHQFDHEGNYISELVTVGEGPENINNIHDFLVSETQIEVLCGKGAFSEIVFFSIGDKKIVDKVKLNAVGFSFEKINNNYFIYSSYNYPIAEYRVLKTDLNGSLLTSYLKNDYTGLMLPVVERNFFRSAESVFLVESFNNRIYELFNDGVKSKYELDFKGYNIPAHFWENDMMAAFPELNNNGFFSILNHFENSRISLTGVIFQKDDKTEAYHLIVNKDLNKISKNKLDNNWRDLFKTPVGITETNKLVFSTHPFNLTQNLEMFVENIPLYDDIKKLESQDNPVLVYSDLELEDL